MKNSQDDPEVQEDANSQGCEGPNYEDEVQPHHRCEESPADQEGLHPEEEEDPG